MTDEMNDEARRQAFIGDETNLDLAVQDVAEAIRDLLRALAAKDPSEPISRATRTLRSILGIWKDEFPAEKVLNAAVAQLVALDDARSQDGAIIDTVRPALAYFAEATATDNFAQARLGKTRRLYEDGIDRIDARNERRSRRGDRPEE